MSSFAFALEQGEPVDTGARRLAKDGAASVLAAIESAGARADQREELVHDARRTLKRLRALVRLLSGEKAMVHQLRDAARPLGAARDSAVMVRTFDKISHGDPRAAAIRKRLMRARQTAEQDVEQHSADGLRAFASAIDDWKLEDGWRAIEPGLRQSYRAGRKALRRASEHHDPEAMHTLRKRCKDLQYQLGLLREVWPAVIRGYGDATSDLSKLLGDDHDLVVLREELERRVAGGEPWLDRIDKKRRKLRAKIFPLAERIYADSTSVFMERFATWWHASRE